MLRRIIELAAERRPEIRDRQQPDLDQDGGERQPNKPPLSRMTFKNVRRHAPSLVSLFPRAPSKAYRGPSPTPPFSRLSAAENHRNYGSQLT